MRLHVSVLCELPNGTPISQLWSIKAAIVEVEHSHRPLYHNLVV